MSTVAQLLKQRSTGSLEIRFGRGGVEVLREAGSAKCRVPRGSAEAIMINTSGGLAGGDRLDIAAEVMPGARLTLTSQAAERVYRSLGPAAEVQVNLKAASGAFLCWLPQETILFEGSALSRSLSVDLAADAAFLAVESLVLGRREMGEDVQALSVRDYWTIRRAGRLVHREALSMGPQHPRSAATLAEAGAMATVLMVAPDVDRHLNAVRASLGPDDGASAWSGKLVARLLAKDGFHLRKTLIQVFSACVGQESLPKTWTF